MNLDSYFSRSPQARISSIRETDACGLFTKNNITCDQYNKYESTDSAKSAHF